MTDITSVDGYPPTGPVQRNEASAPPAVAEPGDQVGPGRAEDDRVELSELGQLLASARDLPDIRMDKVIAVREQIRAGTYETPDKIEITANRLLRDLL
ncbi:MAG: flagellar biosynthesis anti-sigma factor FlgM [Phycisphaerales bacterium]|nr:MAG: flagellar biosynthesis anti-sigma factor FlgM [Phycisphaerales bacterium]